MSASSKRRRATSPSSSVSGGGDLEDVSSTPGSGRKRKRMSGDPPVDSVSALNPCDRSRVCGLLMYSPTFPVWISKYSKRVLKVLNYLCSLDCCMPRAVQRCQGSQGWSRETSLWTLSKGTKKKVLWHLSYDLCWVTRSGKSNTMLWKILKIIVMFVPGISLTIMRLCPSQ